ncbi:hypothetical protein PV735_15335 [Streptomyces turgidiscabies]|uniref:hypothetical protein n=1 Tax=Streptomyces TaxID=1883 RepID=UPI000662ABBF|nr:MULTISPECIES: hypothetical protein [Streptomyces]MDX3494051.1 hypothetical protein [Streptomyces turgidiscabies]GAQ68579.1 hypothetical protein T45_00290 [Streptomyces turgidiscabies]
MTHIKPGRIFVACDLRDSIRIRIEQYNPGDMRALVTDAATGRRRRLMLISALHTSAFTNAGVPRRSGYAPATTESATPTAVPPVGVLAEQEPDWFEGMTGRQFRVALPPRLTLLNANQRLHHHKRAEITRVLRRAAWAASRAVPHLERVHIIGVLHPEDRQRRDPANWYPSFKACIDGLVDQGVLDDDDHTRVVGPDMRMGHVVEGARLVLHIRDLSPVDMASDLRK